MNYLAKCTICPNFSTTKREFADQHIETFGHELEYTEIPDMEEGS